MTESVCRNFTHDGLASLVLVAGVFASSAVFAAEPGVEEITVRAERPAAAAAVEVVGRSTVGAPIELVTLEYSVNYADLDLATSLGADTLRKRVGDAAKVACDELNTKYPLSERDRSCVSSAEKDAMLNVEEAIKLAQAR